MFSTHTVVRCFFSEYYFSVENLKSDTFLRHSMDVHGWVPVEVVCGFKRVRQLSVGEEAVIQVITAELCYTACTRCVQSWLCTTRS